MIGGGAWAQIGMVPVEGGDSEGIPHISSSLLMGLAMEGVSLDGKPEMVYLGTAFEKGRHTYEREIRNGDECIIRTEIDKDPLYIYFKIKDYRIEKAQIVPKEKIGVVRG